MALELDSQADAAPIDALLAQTADKYDAIPYTSKPFPQTHPLRIGGIAKMFGLDVVPAATARVLELGGASGGNLIPMAAQYPDGHFVGIDLSAKQIDEGNQRIARLGLTNIKLICGSLSDIGPELGEFDYIISHGVYSWIPPEIQDALLRVSRQNLSAKGVAYISYNVLPGWRMWQAVRDACLLMIPASHEEVTRVEMARDLMEFLRDYTPGKGPYADVMRSTYDRLKNFPDDYIAHEYLEDANHPTSFRDFLSTAAKHGLGYLGETDHWLMFPSNHGNRFAAEVMERTTNDIVSVEQMLDVMHGRTFRQTLLVPQERLSQIKRHITLESTSALHFLPNQNLRLEKNNSNTAVVDADGRVIETRSAAAGVALERLLAAFPASITLDECAKGMTDAERDEAADALHRILIYGMVAPLSEALPIGKLSGRPKIIDVARSDVSAGMKEVVSLRHEAIGIDLTANELIPFMNGANNHKDLSKAMVDAAIAGRLEFSTKGAPIKDPKTLQMIVAELIPKILSGLQMCGLIEP